MAKPLIDPDALVTMFESATAQQGAQLKKAATDATLAALQGRELTLKNIRAALKSVSEAASAGAAKNAMAGVDPGALLDNAVAGMDAALLKAVEANRVALSQLAAQGASLREKHLKKAIDDLDKFEDTMFAALKKTAEGAGAPLAGAWGQVLEKMQAGGTLAGAKASTTAEQFTEQMQTAIKTSRAAGMRAAQALAESYTAMVSGVLIGMSDALQSQGKKK
jgi:benzoyl-CoA reductase/2-hydroxyglutaryl-CoA dehydratase subunit BcrC/BadD/HgdB